MNSDNHYYVDGYSLDDGPYCLANGVLVNKLEITNTQDLNEVEAELAALAISHLLSLASPKEFSTASLINIHREIFFEIYPWAGKFRTVDIAKGNTHFEAHENIESRLNSLFASCQSQNYFNGLNKNDFATYVADFFIELNRIHPFREGNGRTQRLLLSQLARNAGYKIAWEGISESAMKEACIAGLEGNPSKMKKIIQIYLSEEAGKN
jgi:cell filamentation protein